MTVAQYAGLIAAALGAIGTTILFFSSYTLEHIEAAPLNSPAVEKHDKRI